MTDKPTPRPGDVLLGCIHKPIPYFAHVFLIPNPHGLPFRRPDGTTASAKWIVLCDRCHVVFLNHDGVLTPDVPIGCDAVWRDDDEPIKYREPS